MATRATAGTYLSPRWRWLAIPVALISQLAALTLFATPASAQTGWTDQFGSNASDYAESVAVDSSGVYVTGYTFGALPGQTSAGGSDAFVRRLDPAGNVIWTRQFGTSQEEVAHGVAVDATGVVVTGRTSGVLAGHTSFGDWDAFVRRYDTAGNVLWTSQFGSSGKEVAYDVAVEASAIYVIGWTRGALPGQTHLGLGDSFLRRYDTSGNVIWTRQFGTGGDDLAHGVAVDSSVIYTFSGTTAAYPGQSHAGHYDAVVHRYDSAGNVVWTRQFGSPAQEFNHDIAADASGAYIAGSTRGALPGQTQVGSRDAFLRRYDTAGNVIWTRQYGTSGDDVAQNVAVEGSAIHVAGWTSGALPGQSNAGGTDPYLRRYDSAGSVMSTSQFGTISDDQALGIAVDGAATYVSGHTHGAFPGQSGLGGVDAFICRGMCPDANDPPTADANGPYLAAVDEVIQLSGTGSVDPDGDPLTFAWDYDQDGQFDDAAGPTPSYSSHLPGVFTIGMEVADNSGASDTDAAIVVVYDPDGGFVTGGGTIDSPPGAYVPDPALTGEAHFGFVSRYKKNATVPSGQTQFQFQVGELNFHSDAYQWLVVAGPHAKYKGTGTINGTEGYGFMISVTDAALTPSTDVDQFRIRIWDKGADDAVVYDNELGAGELETPMTPIRAGSIVIHDAN